MKMAPKTPDACSAFCKKNYTPTDEYDYDLIVIGNGCGGLSAAREAAAFGAKVALVDHTSAKTQWGLIGTCTTVGGVLTKLMHQTAVLGEAIQESRFYGWKIEKGVTHNWNNLTDAIRRQISSLNCTIKAQLKENKIHYIRGKGSFKDPHTVHVTTHDGEQQQLTAKYILIAVGTIPRYPDICGFEEHGITADELLRLDKPPGKTLLIGSGRVGIECAGFLHGLGCEVTVIDRITEVMGRFDQQMTKMVLHELEDMGMRLLYNCEITSMSKSICSGKLKVSWKKQDNDEPVTEDFDTVICAVGRKALTKELHLENAGVQIARDGEKIDTNKPELTMPVAAQVGTLLARRLFGGSTLNMDYEIGGAMLFTPLEYSFAGLSEDAAIDRYGEEGIEVYHGYYKPAEFALPQRSSAHCYLKVVGLRDEKQKILGMHFMGPNAGEVSQGFVTALKCGLTIEGLFNTVGVHTTNAEEFIKLTVTKRSGVDPHPAACCN